jgi:hypothetical protein
MAQDCETDPLNRDIFQRSYFILIENNIGDFLIFQKNPNVDDNEDKRKQF